MFLWLQHWRVPHQRWVRTLRNWFLNSKTQSKGQQTWRLFVTEILSAISEISSNSRNQGRPTTGLRGANWSGTIFIKVVFFPSNHFPQNALWGAILPVRWSQPWNKHTHTQAEVHTHKLTPHNSPQNFVSFYRAQMGCSDAEDWWSGKNLNECSSSLVISNAWRQKQQRKP